MGTALAMNGWGRARRGTGGQGWDERPNRKKTKTNAQPPHHHARAPLLCSQVCYKSAQFACPSMADFFQPWDGPFYYPINYMIGNSMCCTVHVPP